MMRILHVDHSPVLGGAERSVFELAWAQQRLGHDVAVAVGRPDGLSSALQEAGVRWHDLRWPDAYIEAPANASLKQLVATVPRAVRSGQRLEQLVRQVDPDVIQIHTRKTQLVAALTSQFPGSKVVFHLHEWPPERPILRAAAALALKRADHAVAVSRSVVKAYRHMRVMPRSGTISAVPSPVGTARLRELETPWLDGRRRPVVGFVGHIGRNKGPHLLVQAAPLLADLDVEFRFIGGVWFPASEAGYARWFETLLDTSPARSRITRIDTVGDPVDAFAGIDVLVHTSTYPEGFGRVIVEAMAARRPVVAFRLGPVPEIVNDDSAWFAAARTPAAVAEAIRAVVSDRDAARQRADVAAAQATRFDPDAVARRMDDEYGRMGLLSTR